MAQLILSHRCLSGLHSHMKLHTTQFQYVFNDSMNFRFNLKWQMFKENFISYSHLYYITTGNVQCADIRPSSHPLQSLLPYIMH